MKVLVTGGAGYIGSHTVIEILEKTGHEVISADNYLNATPEAFGRIEKITGKRVVNYEVDLADQQQTELIFKDHKDIKGIIHFAALKAVGESVEKPLLYYNNNLGSLVNLLSCVQKYGIPNFIFSSSCTVYGELKSLPVTEKTPVQQPKSPYGKTKLMGEQILKDFSIANKHANCISLRYFNPVGAHSSGLIGELPLGKPNNLLPVITQTAAGIIDEMKVHGNDYKTRDGTCIRDYIHVSDIAKAHVQALDHLNKKMNSNRYDILNLGSGKGVTVLEIINAFEKISGRKLNYQIGRRRPGDVEAIYSDSSKAESILGWRPEYTVDEMVKSAWKWQNNISPVIRGDKARHE